MTVIRPNSISGITSITAQANEINVFRSNGLIAGLNLNGVNFNTTAGISTLAALKITGNLDVGGVLTYQDVTNVDSLGIGTFRTGINVSGGQLDVGSNIKLGNAGVITATSFVGGLPITSGADNRVITASSASAIQGEANLHFDGTSLAVGKSSSAGAVIDAYHATSNTIAQFESGDAGASIILKDNATYSGIQQNGNDFIIESDPGGTRADSTLLFKVDGAERIRIKASGYVGIGTDNPGTALEVNNGNGQQQLRVRNHIAAGSFDGNYGSEFRHAYSSANHAMLIHSQESGTARRVLDISNSNGLFATFTHGFLGMGGLTTPSAKLHALDNSSTTTTILKLRNYKSSVNTKPRMAFEASTSAGQGANSFIQGLAGTDAAGSNSNNESGLEFIVTYGGSGTERSAMKLDHDGVCTVPRQPKFNIRCNTNNTFGQGGNYNTNYLSPIPTFTPGNRTELTMRAFTVTYPSYAGGNYPKIVVPVDGFYMFGFAGCYFIQNSSDFVGFGFNVNNEGNANTGSPTYLISAAQSNNNYYDIVHNISGSVGIQLSANDFVVLYQWSSTSGRFDGNVHLYGYLVG